MSFFKKLFGKNETEDKKSLDTPISEIQKERQGSVNIGQSIYPIIKRKDDPKLNLLKGDQQVLTVDLVEDLFLCFNLDMGNHYEMIQKEFLSKTNLTIEDLKAAAMRNLVNKINKNCKVGVEDFSEGIPEAKPFYSVHFDTDLNTSIFLLDDFWENNAKEIAKSDLIAVSMPAKNIIYFSDMRLMESFRTMRPVASHMYKASIEDNIHLTENTYIRKDGKWILFLDTEEQLAELW